MDRIKGIAADREIDHLIKEKKWFKVIIPAISYEKICIVEQKRKIENSDYFRIDVSDKLITYFNLASEKPLLKFEFRGSDNVQYQFSSKNFRLLDNQLWICRPESIERIQKRNNFRILTPQKANLVLLHKESQLTLKLENISIGGAFASIRSNSPIYTGITAPKLGQQYQGILLNFPTDIMETPICILLSQIIRIEKGYQKNRDGYAFHFIEITSDQKNLLTRVVYHLQRRFLKERIKS